MRFKTVELPYQVYIGEGVISKLQKVLRSLKTRYFLLLTDEVVKNLVVINLIEQLSDWEYDIMIVESAKMEEARKIVLKSGFADYDTVVGIGGGKVLDVSKVVATELNASFISIPTTASHDGVASPVASFKENGKPVSISTNPPSAVIADLNIIKNCPIRLLRSGYGDLVSNISSVKDWQLARDFVGEDYNEVAASIAVMPAQLMISKADEIDLTLPPYLLMLMRGLIMSGVAIGLVGTSRPASGAEHKFSHALDYLGYGNGTHGEQVSIGTIIMEFLHERHYGRGDWEQIKSSLEKVHAPTTAKEIGLNKDQILEALMLAKKLRKKRYTILEAVNPTKEDFELVLSKTGIA
ncbi:sn-glycerol-1-phosphate dehydrogenase [Archaeoglobus neptunius]|uniref:sn-glycerol-1-phosphate dehydrogenase n=1 Tax=Archaeoglobus neptunius TaxID=2798580 RepID=UPI001925C839|nr:sn-glycerol-1-phosphate dehydrogenase [Archaeoglobus neptunius]